MSPPDDPATLIANPEWLPTHWEPPETVRFVRLAREEHAQLTFLSNEYLGPLNPPTTAAPLSALSAATTTAAPQYIFHSAFCASTLLTRALDAPGVAMGLKEPQILNELTEAARQRALSGELLQTILRLLARPFGAGERVVIKPSNVVNLLAPTLLEGQAGSNALFLYAPLPRFLGSVADKGLWGRRWARRLYALLQGDTGMDFGLPASEQFELTDMQVTALAWLMHHAQGLALIARFPKRVRTLDSETFLARRADTLLAIGGHFGLNLDRRKSDAIAGGPAFATHSKEIGRAFDPEEPLQQKAAAPVIADELAMVTEWTRSVADQAGIPMAFSPQSALLPPR